MSTNRKPNGNMLLLMSVVFGLLFFIVICGVAFNYVLLKRTRGQYTAESMALSLAGRINANDRVGNLNELQEASRELVFVSRQHCNQCANDTPPEFTALCARLLDDARSNHVLIEDERQNQISVIAKEVQEATLAYNRERSSGTNLAFLGLRAAEPEVTRVELGRIANVNCNVKVLDGITELSQFDNFKQYFDPTSKLYKSDIDAKLPSPDSDLDFHFSSLPAYVGNTCTPSRNTNANVFVPYGTIYADGRIKNTSTKEIPSAIRIIYNMNVDVPWDHRKTTPIELAATGSANGALSSGN